MENLKGKFDSVIFDLDGTLWDSTGTVAHAWQTALNKVPFMAGEVMTRERVRSITGMAYDAIFKKLFPNLADEQRAEVQQQCSIAELDILHRDGGELYPGLADTLAYLAQHYQLYIVSNCQSGYIELFLDQHQMHTYFLGHQCYGTKGNPKADNIRDIVNDHNLQAPVYVGDTTGDHDAATKAGVPFMFAAYGFGRVEEGQIATINQFTDLQQLL
ncbi:MULTISPECIES: HAD family hydrolase [unclassified Mucilaginibacter]|mgnify:CR=1 FL=1|uniref:HAD family hydrolase n=1 Tax=unclassified Mucilaginibacter TaxID=2617802 RepID=UPI00095ACA17|nr:MULTISPECIES: HAD family hydrolase [unclassified Mucilaginibacter]OJW13434.1 MAG: phosphoglycolate phosphatase [Mucilaginibacter sp. 44-25]PLW88785.1 MAG: HAD family hydrolase [Mucilaginibacter sp.]HEK21235.1 HAD family hydrolase [Bacteroidota bacterium]